MQRSFPPSFDLKQLLVFSPEKGLLTLGDERLLLFSQKAVSLLRSLLFTQLGPDMSRMLLAQFGYQHGAGDYKLLTEMFTWDTDEQRLEAGPLMHAWSGIVHVEPVHFEMDRSSGHFHFRGYWHHSYEAEIYKKSFGTSQHPVCHTLAGYGSGWCSAFFGQPLLEIERKCVACGDEFCEWEIRPWDEWGPEAEPWKKSLLSTSQSVYQDLLTSNRKILELNQNLEIEVERRSAENRRLLRMLCHDLVVPMKAMKQSVMVLGSSPSTTTAASAHAKLEECVDTVQTMLSQVREAEGEASGKIAAQPHAFPLSEAILTIERMFEAQFASKRLTFQVMNRLGPQDHLWVPPITFTMNILSNLIANAIKFSPCEATVFLEAEREGDAIKVTVRDEGIGIPARLRPHLFSMQLPTSQIGTAGEKGTGFGLPIVKSYIELLGGRIEIQSRSREEEPSQHGTTVHIYLPRAGET